jgi:hypothetical protein
VNRWRCVWRSCFVVLAGASCGDERDTASTTGTTPDECLPPNRLVGDGCREPGVQDDGCPAGTLGSADAGCVPAGIPADACGNGFVHDGDVGCEPILPPGSCPAGRMAVPGDAECRPVMPCAPGKWGDIPTNATTEHVDGAYTGGDSDGTATRPWTSIGDAVAAAAPDAIVAVAAGSYVEDVVIDGTPVVLWGVCPDEVAIVGTTAGLAAVVIVHADDTTLRGVAVTGPNVGVAMSGAENVLIDAVRVHDAGERGIHAEETLGATSFLVRGSLVEGNSLVGVSVRESQVTLEATVVRGTRPDAEGFLGEGVSVPGRDSGTAQLVVIRSLIEHNREAGVYVTGARATFEDSVIRGTVASPAGDGRGLYLAEDEDSGAPSDLTMRGCLVEQNQEVGIFLGGSPATVDATVVRGAPADAPWSQGRGINLQRSPFTGLPATILLRRSLIERNEVVGLFVRSSEATVEATVIRDTAGRQPWQGRGVEIENDPETTSGIVMRGCRVEHSGEFGIAAFSSTVTIEGTLVSATAPNSEQKYGDGISVLSQHARASASLRACRVEDSARAGVSSFGASVSILDTAVVCSAFELEGEPVSGMAFDFEDRGGNQCGCTGAEGDCGVESAGLAPPEPVKLSD